MQGNKKLLVVVALLLLLTLTFTSYAIYKTSLAGNATVNAAKWNVVFKEDGTAISDPILLTFDATDCPGNNHTANNVIAPGAYCEKTIQVDVGDTQVDVLVTAVAGDPTIGGSAVDSDANEFQVTTSVDATNGIIAYSDNTRVVDVTVTIAWDDEEGSPYDAADTAIAGQTITVPVTLTAKQVVGNS